MQLPKRVPSEISAPPQKEIIEKKVKITKNGNQFVLRIPKPIVDFLKLKYGDIFEFRIEVSPPDKPKEESLLSFRIIRGGNNG